MQKILSENHRSSVRIFVLFFCLIATNVLFAAQESEKRFSFAVVGHVIGRDDGRANPLLEELVSKLRKLDIDLVFLTGDMIWGFVNKTSADARVVKEDWERLDTKLRQLNVPIYRVPGNHDIQHPLTRDIYFERYGQLPRAVEHSGSLFILINSSHVPEGRRQAPYRYFRGKQLDLTQIEFIRKTLSTDEVYDHVFVFMHHLLWWSDQARWWKEVHPLLISRGVRAVFSGEFGPMKFSHLSRDGIDYLQSGIEDAYSIDDPGSIVLLRSNEYDRLRAHQFDNFLLITVSGSNVSVEVKTIGGVSTGKFSPQRWREIHGDVEHEPPPRPLAMRIWSFMSRPGILGVAIALFGFCSFLTGFLAQIGWRRLNVVSRKKEIQYGTMSRPGPREDQ